MIEFITYKEKKHPIRVGYRALKRLKAEHGKDLESLGQEDDAFETYEPLLFYAMESGAKATGVPFKFVLTDMEDVLDECFFEFISLVPKFFPKSMAQDLVTENLMKRKKK